jgi:hypothetical protein
VLPAQARQEQESLLAELLAEFAFPSALYYGDLPLLARWRQPLDTSGCLDNAAHLVIASDRCY